jgi:predicted transcriptional regulator
MSAKLPKPVTRRVRSTRSKSKRTKPSHAEIAERAYFISLEERSSDEIANWVRAERELTAA